MKTQLTIIEAEKYLDLLFVGWKTRRHAAWFSPGMKN